MQRFSTHVRWFARAALAAAALSGAGCASVRNAPSALISSLMTQSDPLIVEAGTPAYLLLMDALVESSPGSARLLLASSDANTAYAAAFLNGVSQERARLMYAKARDYALRVLRGRRVFRRAENQRLEEFEQAVAALGRRDVPAMYSAAAAWLGWIVNSPDSMAAAAQLSRALALMRRVMELSPGYRGGGPEMFFGIYYAVQPRGAGRDLDRSRELFEASMAYAGEDLLLPRVACAEYWARYAFDREAFERMLNEVLAHEADPPAFRLLNAVARERARRLLERADDFF